MAEITDHRARARITSLEGIVMEHIDSHKILEDSINENTQLTRTISENTAEIVSLIKGIKGLRGFVLWLAPFVAGLSVVGGSVVYWWKL